MASRKDLQKPCYDISMSKRTRKPLNLKIEPYESIVDEHIRQEIVEEKGKGMSKEVIKFQKQKSLKPLLESHRSLAKQFKVEEKQLNLVVKKQQDGLKGVKLNKMLGNCVKAFTHMIKGNQESRKKQGNSLKLIGFK